jgi:hypothetical protein
MFAGPQFGAIRQHLMFHPSHLVAAGTDQHNVADMNGCFALNTAGLSPYVAGASLVLDHQVNPGHHHPILAGIRLACLAAAASPAYYPLDLTTLALELASDDLNGIACLDTHHSTSGANDTIFM